MSQIKTKKYKKQRRQVSALRLIILITSGVLLIFAGGVFTRYQTYVAQQVIQLLEAFQTHDLSEEDHRRDETDARHGPQEFDRPAVALGARERPTLSGQIEDRGTQREELLHQGLKCMLT